VKALASAAVKAARALLNGRPLQPSLASLIDGLPPGALQTGAALAAFVVALLFTATSARARRAADTAVAAFLLFALALILFALPIGTLYVSLRGLSLLASALVDACPPLARLVALVRPAAAAAAAEG
jgi:hypothetical protein